MKKSRAKSPYINGKPRFKTRKRPGVYVIYKNSIPVYVGYSGSDVYKTLYRHFQSWNDPRQIRKTYSKSDANITIRVVYTRTAKQASDLEYALIVKYQPADNPLLYLPDQFNTEPVQSILNKYEDISIYQGDDPF